MSFAHRNQNTARILSGKIFKVQKEEENPSKMLVSVWDALSTQTIVNCFRKSGISTESQETHIVRVDDLFLELRDEIDDLRYVQPNLTEDDFDETDFNNVDTEVVAV